VNSDHPVVPDTRKFNLQGGKDPVTRSRLLNLGWIVPVLVGAPLAWFAYLVAVPDVNAEFQIGRLHELGSWINVSLMPLLGFLALAIYLATGKRIALALAVAALAFAAVFPLHRLFTAERNFDNFLFYGTLGRVMFVGVFLIFARSGVSLSAVRRRRNVLLILGLTGLLALLRYLLKEQLDVLADPQGFFLRVHRRIEWAAIVLSAGAAVRLWLHSRAIASRRFISLPVAFLLIAEESLFFLYSDSPDLFWWSGNLLWGVATILLIGAVLNLAAEAGRQRLAAQPGDELAPGSILGPYEILQHLGEGGMGRVYQARHQVLKKVVAIKVIRREQLANPNVLQRFHREALAAAQLAHSHIVRLYDASEADGNHFLVMEYVAGCDLGDLVEKKGPLPLPLACEYIRQTALGLQHAYERGLVHRDIKPANLLVTADGSHVKIMDMGVMGTPAYLAPEQARDARQADIRSDIYSLGCTFYHLLSGTPPFHGMSLAELVLCHQFEDPAPIEQKRPEVAPELAAIIRKMMAKQPQDRYQTPAEVAEELQAFVAARV